jgi:hypothetical protein
VSVAAGALEDEGATDEATPDVAVPENAARAEEWACELELQPPANNANAAATGPANNPRLRAADATRPSIGLSPPPVVLRASGAASMPACTQYCI